MTIMGFVDRVGERNEETIITLNKNAWIKMRGTKPAHAQSWLRYILRSEPTDLLETMVDFEMLCAANSGTLLQRYRAVLRRKTLEESPRRKITAHMRRYD